MKEKILTANELAIAFKEEVQKRINKELLVKNKNIMRERKYIIRNIKRRAKRGYTDYTYDNELYNENYTFFQEKGYSLNYNRYVIITTIKWR